MSKLLIKGGTVVFPTKSEVCDLLIENKKIIKQDIVSWVLDHQELVLSCPYNRISTTLIDLQKYLYEKYGIKDWRSFFICFDNTKSLKTMLDKLKEIIYISKENVC